MCLLRRTVLVILVLLQCIAPLVHAHTGQQYFGKGLHIPGLESYNGQTHNQYVQALSTSNQDEGFLVAIHAGIKSQQIDTDVDLDQPAFLPPELPVIITNLSEFDVNFSPHTQPNVFSPLVVSHFARAPPRQSRFL